MTISSALWTGVSGLTANSTALGAISDNIVNVNTTGYKQNRTDFQDLVTEQSASLIGLYNSGGVNASVRQLVSEQGQLSQTNSATDLGVNGAGFFVTTDRPTAAGVSEARTFTRAGSFTPDAEGNLKNPAGLYLQGWAADASGAVATDPSDLTKLSTINVNAGGGAPNPTSRASLEANLNSTQAVSVQEAGYTAGAMAAYDAASGTGVKPDATAQIPVYDSKGGKHTVEIDFLKSTTPNQWHAEVRAVPASDVQGVTNGLLGSGVVAFTADGKFDASNTTLPLSLALGASSGGTGASWATGLGVAAQTVALNLSTSPGALTQYALASGVSSVTGDGGPVGKLTNVTVNDRGDVIANFDNGLTRRIAQVALATFPNPDGLTSISGTAFRAAAGSGVLTLKTAGRDGAGDISPSTLEGSTVDLSAQFTGLITTQRAYSASSKIITTADQMLQDIIDLKR